MIETYKITSGIYDQSVTENMLPINIGTRTRGHSKKLETSYCRRDIRKYNFTNRIIKIWNNLPEQVVNARSVKQFKSQLDRYWARQEVKFDLDSDIQT